MHALLIALLILLGSHTAQDSAVCSTERFEDGSSITSCTAQDTHCTLITDAETQEVSELHCAQ